MPRINNNPIMKGVSGMLGGVVVYRQFRGMTIMSNRPRKAKVMTPHQQAIKSRFLLAVEFAKKQLTDPVLKAKYEPGPGSEFASAYIAAVTDYLRRAKQNENRLEDKKIANNQDSLEPAVCVNAETDKSDAKINVVEYSENVAEGRAQHVRTDTDFVHSYTVTRPYSFNTVTLSGAFAEKCSQMAAKDQLQVSRVCIRRENPFTRCFNGILRSRAPTMAIHSVVYREFFNGSQVVAKDLL